MLAFLNGCDLRAALRGQVLLAKMFGTILAVGGGLALGPEGRGFQTGSCNRHIHIGSNTHMSGRGIGSVYKQSPGVCQTDMMADPLHKLQTAGITSVVFLIRTEKEPKKTSIVVCIYIYINITFRSVLHLCIRVCEYTIFRYNLWHFSSHRSTWETARLTGPMVHIGAIVGMVMCRRCLAPCLKRLGPFSRTVEEELSRQPLRYHVQAAVMGAGAGIAAAFNAPLAGTVFVVEEAASFFSKKLLLHSFICCAFAVMTCNVLSDYVLKLPRETIYSRTSACIGIESWMDSPWMAFHVAVVGALCGLLAIFFNRIVVALGIYFAEEAQRLGRGPKLFLRRFAYSIVIGCCCGAFAIVLPKSQPCPDSSVQHAFYGSSGCILEEWLQQVVQGSRYVPAAYVPREFQGDKDALVMSYEPRDGVFGAQYNPNNCREAISWQKDCEVPGIEAAINKSKFSATLNPKDFCCSFQDLDSLRHGDFFNVSDGREPKTPLNMGENWPRGPCMGFTKDDKDKKAVDHYSPGAALTLVPPTAVVRNLLVRGAPFVLPMSTVATFLLGYFMLAACCSTASGPHSGVGRLGQVEGGPKIHKNHSWKKVKREIHRNIII